MCVNVVPASVQGQCKTIISDHAHTRTHRTYVTCRAAFASDVSLAFPCKSSDPRIRVDVRIAFVHLRFTLIFHAIASDRQIVVHV